jgi:hypothetical protein
MKIIVWNTIVAVTCALSISTLSCRESSSPSKVDANSNSSGPKAGALTKQEDPVDSVATWLASDPAEARAWQAFVASGTYRAARSDDFHLAAWAMEQLNADTLRRMELPIEGGDINHDGSWGGFAVQVVDLSLPAPENFGVIIFIRQEEDGEFQPPHWLCSGKDLSHTLLGWWNGGLLATEYRDDGTRMICNVIWNPKRGKYTCEEESRRPSWAN